MRKVYAGPVNPRTGESIFPGWPLGSEGYGPGPNDGWRNFLDVPEPRRVGFFRYFVFDNPAWDPWSMDWDRDVAYTTARVGFLNATSHDLRPFRERGGKIVMHTGWSDPILPAPDVIKYLRRSHSSARRIRNPWVLPALHGAGHGPLQRRTRPELARRALRARSVGGTRNRARGDRRDASSRRRIESSGPGRSASIPKVARWNGRGSSDEATNFACVDPGARRADDLPGKC